ncbi:hypothetical protein C2S53_014959 [Perilla frutescens var. hirtella]|uniref:Uncharacterized protein n=1 Tax=Perilla frutescens var. hirtella TaxID=608512 RepID=A0AAD4J6I3_PERFH|nr:hypothetical protein C2S53_014959 [Perilla frutescens var. hirtella]
METLLFYYSLAIFFTCLLYSHPEGAGAVGINYGVLGNNLPPYSAVVSRLQQINVTKIRIFQPNNDLLTALHNAGISVIVGTYNQDLKQLATDPSAASAWVAANIIPHLPYVKITSLAAGNEVYPGELQQYLPAAMQNLDAALVAAFLAIPVTTAISMQTLSSSYPPSAGVFTNDSTAVMGQIAQFLSSKKYPLLLNVYPYYARVGDPANVELDYALFKSGNTSFDDGPNTYVNLFDALLDAVYTALEKVCASNVEIVVSETGWPSGGGSDASIENAHTYVNNLIQHVTSGKGTPRRPGKEIQTYIFAMFNENEKGEGVEQHWGLHYPDLTPVYHVNHF